MVESRLYFRVIQQDERLWSCRRGREEIDDHASRQEAVDHMIVLASKHRPSEVFVHHCDGVVESVLTLT